MRAKEQITKEEMEKVTDRRKSKITDYELLNLDRPDRWSGSDRRRRKDRRVK